MLADQLLFNRPCAQRKSSRASVRFTYRVLEDAHVAAAAEDDDVVVAPQAGRVTHPEEDARAGR